MSLDRDDVTELRAVLEAAAARGELLERAVVGLSDEQIEAIPALIEWFVDPPKMQEAGNEFRRLCDVFPRREAQS